MGVTAPLEGAFWTRPSPADPPFAAPGTTVKPGDTVGLIEVMKTFIQVTAEEPGTFEKYAVQNAAPVTAGDVVAELK